VNNMLDQSNVVSKIQANQISEKEKMENLIRQSRFPKLETRPKEVHVIFFYSAAK
jgi:hypothetical protein